LPISDQPSGLVLKRPLVHRGFTLLEITVAVAIGTLILYTAYAGFRVSTQTVTLCNRMSLENRLMTAGMLRAIDDVDFWTDLDREGHVPLRTIPRKAINGHSGGYDPDGADSLSLPQPFTPFASSWQPGLNQIPAVSNVYQGDWRPDDPRTWYRGDGFLFLQGNQRPEDSVWGNYGLFSGVDANVTHGNASVTVGALAGTTGVPVDRYTFTAAQHKGLKYALGFYGWWDYLPANAIIDWSDRNGTRATKPFELRERYEGEGDRPPSNIGQFSSGFRGIWISGNERPQSRSSYLWEQVLCISAPRPNDATNEVMRLNRWMAGHGDFINESASPISVVLSAISRPADMDAQRPGDWPRVTAEVRRYKIFARTSQDCFVRMFDPATGKMVELDFRTVGSTLRGARLQRRTGVEGPVLPTAATLDG